MTARCGRAARHAAGIISLTLALTSASPLTVALHGAQTAAHNGGAPPAQSAVLRTVRVGLYPVAVAVDVHTRRVFVLNQGPGQGFVDTGHASVSVLDAATGTLLTTTPLMAPSYLPRSDPGPFPAGVLAVDARSGRVFVATQTPNPDTTSGSAGHVSVLDAASGALLRTVAVTATPSMLVVAAQTGRVFSDSHVLLDARSGAILRHDLTWGDPLAVDSHRGRVFLANTCGLVGCRSRMEDRVSVLDARSGALLFRIRLANLPQGIDGIGVDERAGRVLLVTDANRDFNAAPQMRLLDAVTGKTVRIINNAGGATLAIDAPSSRAFVLSYPQEETGGPIALSVLDTRTGRLVRTDDVGEGELAGLGALAVAPHSNRLFVAVSSVPYESVGLLVLDARSGRILRRLNGLGVGLPAVAVDEQTHRLFAVNTFDNTVSVFDTTHL